MSNAQQRAVLKEDRSFAASDPNAMHDLTLEAARGAWPALGGSPHRFLG